MKQINLLCLTAVFAGILSCSKPAALPEQYLPADNCPEIYPDYKEVTIPPNICPLNFRVLMPEAQNVVAEIVAGSRRTVIEGNEDGLIQCSHSEWKELLAGSRGKDLHIHLYTQAPSDQWTRHKEFAIHVASEPADSYIAYRKIEPGYELYRQMGLYQRNLETFGESVIYENNRQNDLENNHCVNCHNFQNYDTGNMLFHVRSNHGGTILIQNGQIKKLDLRHDSILGPSVYPTWHPGIPAVAFSSNNTGQSFHLLDRQKVEVVDLASDLVYYNIGKNTLSNICRTDSVLENFPCWSPDGSKLYYCAAAFRCPEGFDEDRKGAYALQHYKEIRYNIMSLDFNPDDETFGNPRLVADCASEQKSASVPRISPDGRFLLYTKGDYGQFHIWHRSADLWVKDLHTGNEYPLEQSNSPEADSYHSWSSNGRWIVFASRRGDGNYSCLYLAYFDRNGQAHKAFLLPQEDPMQNVLLLKSYNVPEFSKNAVPVTAEELKEAIYTQEAEQVTYK